MALARGRKEVKCVDDFSSFLFLSSPLESKNYSSIGVEGSRGKSFMHTSLDLALHELRKSTFKLCACCARVLCANNKFYWLDSLSHNNFLHVFTSTSSHSPFSCSLLFVHDGAASTAIWLIKSVIELCDMNNLLLFSPEKEFLRTRFIFRLVKGSRLNSTRYDSTERKEENKFIVGWQGTRCVVCVAYFQWALQNILSSPLFSLLFPLNLQTIHNSFILFRTT